MDYKTFQEQILKTIRVYLPKDSRVQLKEISKNNGLKQMGILLDLGEKSEIAPVVYLESFFDAYKQGEPLEKTAKTIAKILLSPIPQEISSDLFLDWERVKERIVFRLVGKKRNRQMLGQLVYRDFLDMAVTYGIYIENRDNVGGMAVIRKNMAEKWRVTEKELYRCAMKNTIRILGERMCPMADLFEEQGFTLPGSEMPQDQLYVLSNRKLFYGASVLLCSEKLKELSGQLDMDLLILPSSVHESATRFAV